VKLVLSLGLGVLVSSSGTVPVGGGEAMPTEQQSAAARRRALRDAQREAAEAAAAATDAKQQLLAAKARTNLLSSEAANLRTRLRQLLDKGRRDEEYIKLLQVKNRREK